MPNFLTNLFQDQGQNRAPNTLRLRNAYNNYVIDEQQNGRQAMPFEQWAQTNFPDIKILNQGPTYPQGQ